MKILLMKDQMTIVLYAKTTNAIRTLQLKIRTGKESLIIY